MIDKTVDCPTVSENGAVTPVTLSPVPLKVSCEIFRVAVPLFVSVTVLVLLLPTLIVKTKDGPGSKSAPELVPAPAQAIQE